MAYVQVRTVVSESVGSELPEKLCHEIVLVATSQPIGTSHDDL